MRDETKCPQGVAKAEHALHCKCDHYLCWSDMRIQAELARLGPTSEFAARLKAHEALGEKVSCNDPRPGISHDWSCDDVTEVIHGALTRDAEHRAELDAVCNQRDQLMGKLNHVTWARPEVLAFSRLMEAKLRENDHKGGWKEEQTSYLSRRCGNELDELRDAIQKQHKEWMTGFPPVDASVRAQLAVTVGREAADVANFAMMIADVCGALAAPPPAESTPVQPDMVAELGNLLDSVGAMVYINRSPKGCVCPFPRDKCPRCTEPCEECRKAAPPDDIRARLERHGQANAEWEWKIERRLAALEAKGEPGTHAFVELTAPPGPPRECRVCGNPDGQPWHPKGAKP